MLNDTFKIHLYMDEVVHNKTIVDKNEVLAYFTRIDFDNIFISSDALINTFDIIDWTEYYPNFRESTLNDFFKFVNEFNVTFIYTGYLLKTILYKIITNFCMKVFPTKTFKKLMEWPIYNRELNLKYKQDWLDQQTEEIEINDFAHLFYKVANVFLKNSKNDIGIDLCYRYFYHYFQTIIPYKEYAYIVDKNKFAIEFNLSKSINKKIKVNPYVVRDIVKLLAHEYQLYSSTLKIINPNDVNALAQVEKFFHDIIIKEDSFYKWKNFSNDERMELIKKYLSDKKIEWEQKYGSFKRPDQDVYSLEDSYAMPNVEENENVFINDEYEEMIDEQDQQFYYENEENE